jgi:hypothetical protein
VTDLGPDGAAPESPDGVTAAEEESMEAIDGN